jgi:hypothetical protein
MKLLTLLILLLPCVANAQKSVNSAKDSVKIHNTNKPKFIEHIAFTPAGITQPQTVNTQPISNSQPAGNKPVTDDGSNLKSQIRNQKSEIINPKSEIESFSRLQFKYAMLLDVDVECLTNVTLYNFINEWYGSHYHMGGNSKDGIDCSGFSCTLLRKVYNVNPPRTAREQYEASDHVSKDNLQEGDLVFFNTFGGVSHVGVYLANGNFVHASTNYGVIISSLKEGYYKEKFIGAGRIK